jgi:hypothetical protein
VNVGDSKADRPQGEETFHAAATGTFNPRRQNWGDQINAEQHVDEPEVPDIRTEVDCYFEDVEERPLQSGSALPVEVEGVNRTPRDERGQHATESLPEECAFIPDRKEKGSGNHHKQRDAGAK